VIELCRGDYENGRRNLRNGIEYASNLAPVSYAIMLSFLSLAVVLGMYEPAELIDEMRAALRRAESFGDICGIITAQFAYGTALLRADEASRDEAIEVLERARANIVRHNVMATNLMPAISADLSMEAARNGRRDEAIDELRNVFSLHMDGGLRAEIGCAGDALVKLLIDRGEAEDFAEVRALLDDWKVRRPDIPVADLWWVKSSALLAQAEGDPKRYAELSKEYLALCEKLDARGLLAEARRMVGTGRET
jgi:adenylate cyclase